MLPVGRGQSPGVERSSPLSWREPLRGIGLLVLRRGQTEWKRSQRMRSKTLKTEEYPNRDALFDDLLKQIREGRIR